MCKHVSPVVVNTVEGGGHRAHCLSCGALGPVRESPEVARQDLSLRLRPVAGLSAQPDYEPVRRG